MKMAKNFKNDKIISYMKEKYANRTDQGNIFCVGMNDREFVEAIIYELLGEDWCVTDPLGHDQINECAFNDIMLKYKRRYYEKTLEEMRVCVRMFFKDAKDPKTNKDYRDIICNSFTYGYDSNYDEMFCAIRGGESDGHTYYGIKTVKRIW